MSPSLCIINTRSFNLHSVSWSLMNSYYSEHPLNEKCSPPAGSFYHLKFRTWGQPQFLVAAKSWWSTDNSFCQKFYPKAGKIHTRTSFTHTHYTHTLFTYTRCVHACTVFIYSTCSHTLASKLGSCGLCFLHFVCRIHPVVTCLWKVRDRSRTLSN